MIKNYLDLINSYVKKFATTLGLIKSTENTRLYRLKILLTALYDAGYSRIRKTLFIKLVFLIDHYLDRNLSSKPRIFGYNFYVYKYGVFTAELLIDLKRLGISYEKTERGTYIKINMPFIKVEELSKKDRKLYDKFMNMIKLYVIPYENCPDELTLYILENLLRIRPGQKLFYYYIYVGKLINRNPPKDYDL